MAGDSMPKREARNAPFDEQGWGLLQRDLDKVFRLLAKLQASGIDLSVTVGGIDVADHSARHENGGADEISVAGLSGLLADSQTPLAHKTSHQDTGTDEISVTGLAGLLADAQTPLAHALAGVTHNADTLANLNTKISDADVPALAGQFGGTAASPDVRGIRETGGPTLLTLAAITDGQYVKRSGATLVGAAVASGFPALGYGTWGEFFALAELP